MDATAWNINNLTLKNYRNFETLELKFEKYLTVLIGRNSEGKTAILDALAVALGPILKGFEQKASGFTPHDAHAVAYHLDSAEAVPTIEQRYPVEATVSATIADSEFVWRRVRATKKGRTTWGDNGVQDHVEHMVERAKGADGNQVILPVLSYYGVERLVGIRRDQGKIPTTRLGAYDAALDPKSDLTRLNGYLKALTERAFLDHVQNRNTPSAAQAQLDAINAACRSALGLHGWEAPEWNPVVKEITLRSTADQTTLPLGWLSSGVRITAGLVIDLASRMARANPHLGGGELLDQTPGIVLIDEVDLHLHPEWQQSILPGLRETFKRVQFIVTTHSPQVLSTVPAHCIRILDGKTARIPEYSEGLRSDIILRSLQGTSPEPDTANRSVLSEYLRLVHDDEGETQTATDLRKKIDKEMGGVTMVPELVEADAYMTIFGGDE